MKSSHIKTKMNWDIWRATLSNVTDVSEEEKTQAIEAVGYLKSIIGTALEGDHPIFQRIFVSKTKHRGR